MVKHAEMFASDTLLFGRVTYQLFAAQWMPIRTDETGFADRLYSVAKYEVMVFSIITGVSGEDPILAGLLDIDLELVDSRLFDGRVQQLIYIPTVR